jgi:predicted dehydrogenase
LERATLFGVCDIDADRLGAFAEANELAGVKTWTDPDAMLAEEGLAATVLAIKADESRLTGETLELPAGLFDPDLG